MQNEKRTISPLLYYLLTAGLTNLVFVVVGAMVFVLLSPKFQLDTILIGVILFVLLQKSLIVGYVTFSFYKQGRLDKVSGTRVIGFYFGRFLDYSSGHSLAL
jgi:TRAP-type mannitol/chloroaromatic compound transport system permease large subunit